MLANLLQKVLPEIISDIQGAFVDGRQVIDSVVIAHECIDSRFRHHRPGVVCKLDFEKAYDKVDWGFLQYITIYDVSDGVWKEMAMMDKELCFFCSFFHLD